MNAILREWMNLFEEGHGIDGLPEDLPIAKNTLDNLRSTGHKLQGHTTPSTKKDSWSKDSHEVFQHPHDGDQATKFTARKAKPHKIEYYDPNLSDLETQDEDEPMFTRQYPVVKPHLQTEITPLKMSDIIYRGMSFEEYQDAIKTNQIQSHGKMNFNSQEGLTYWTTDTQSAASYANSFAHVANKPSFSRPAYVVAAKRPEKTVHIPGTGEHEVGVPHAIQVKDIIAVWKGIVYHYRPGEVSLSRDSDEYKRGGNSSPSANLIWQRIK